MCLCVAGPDACFRVFVCVDVTLAPCCPDAGSVCLLNPDAGPLRLCAALTLPPASLCCPDAGSVCLCMWTCHWLHVPPQEISERVIRRWLDDLDTDRPLDLYAAFKRLSMDLNLAVFLGLERHDREEQVSEVTDIATTHWHGTRTTADGGIFY